MSDIDTQHEDWGDPAKNMPEVKPPPIEPQIYWDPTFGPRPKWPEPKKHRPYTPRIILLKFLLWLTKLISR